MEACHLGGVSSWRRGIVEACHLSGRSGIDVDVVT